MRGLTAEEYELMRMAHCNRQLTPAEEVVAVALGAAGRVWFDHVGNRYYVRFTPAGREAMRLHEFLAAMGAT